jgi:hypothetical protein
MKNLIIALLLSVLATSAFAQSQTSPQVQASVQNQQVQIQLQTPNQGPAQIKTPLSSLMPKQVSGVPATCPNMLSALKACQTFNCDYGSQQSSKSEMTIGGKTQTTQFESTSINHISIKPINGGLCEHILTMKITTKIDGNESKPAIATTTCNLNEQQRVSYMEFLNNSGGEVFFPDAVISPPSYPRDISGHLDVNAIMARVDTNAKFMEDLKKNGTCKQETK